MAQEKEGGGGLYTVKNDGSYPVISEYISI